MRDMNISWQQCMGSCCCWLFFCYIFELVHHMVLKKKNHVALIYNAFKPTVDWLSECFCCVLLSAEECCHKVHVPCHHYDQWKRLLSKYTWTRITRETCFVFVCLFQKAKFEVFPMWLLNWVAFIYKMAIWLNLHQWV